MLVHTVSGQWISLQWSTCWWSKPTGMMASGSCIQQLTIASDRQAFIVSTAILILVGHPPTWCEYICLSEHFENVWIRLVHSIECH